MNPAKEWFAGHSNPRGVKGTVRDVLAGADVLVAVSRPGAVSMEDLKGMNPDPIVFSLANPVPEIMPADARHLVRVMATGRSDYANQVNNVLCFPGLFRGVLDVQAKQINDEMKIAAAQAIASAVPEGHLHEDYIVPSVFNPAVVRLVARAVTRAAYGTGVACRRQPSYSLSQLNWRLGWP
jgi:malate dehydrogenase (oxaloacetate-decarboxylating)